MRIKRIPLWQKLLVAFLCAVLVQPWGAYPLLAADITPGYTFTSGEANVTHTKLNNAAAGTISTTFYSGKGAAGANPTPGNYTFLGLDSVSGTYKRATLDAWVFDHTSLLSARTAKTAPSLTDSLFISDGGTYKQMSLTNALFAGTASGAPTNETRFPALRGGDIGSLTLSNLLGGLLGSHTLPTNGDVIMVLTENGRAVKQMTLQSLLTGASPGTNYSGTDVTLTWDGTRLRSTRGTNFIDGLTVTNTAPATNDALAVLQDGVLKKLLLRELQSFIGSNYVVQTSIRGPTNIVAGGWSNVVDTSGTTLQASITPRMAGSRVRIKVVLSACSSGGGDLSFLRVVRGAEVVADGLSDGGNRIEAASPIANLADPTSCVFDWVESCGPTNTTYTVQVQAATGNQVYINRTASDANTGEHGRFVSTLILEELLP